MNSKSFWVKILRVDQLIEVWSVLVSLIIMKQSLKVWILTKKTAIIDEIGITAQNNATRLQGRNDPNANTMKMPEAEDMPLHALNMPRIEGSLKCIELINFIRLTLNIFRFWDDFRLNPSNLQATYTKCKRQCDLRILTRSLKGMS